MAPIRNFLGSCNCIAVSTLGPEAWTEKAVFSVLLVLVLPALAAEALLSNLNLNYSASDEKKKGSVARIGVVGDDQVDEVAFFQIVTTLFRQNHSMLELKSEENRKKFNAIELRMQAEFSFWA